MATETSLLVLLPALVTVVTAILSRRPIESLLAGVMVGLLMLEPAGAMIAELRRPTLFVMEGGYDIDEEGINVAEVLKGFESVK